MRRHTLRVERSLNKSLETIKIMEQTLTFKYNGKEINFSDFDEDNEVCIQLTDEFRYDHEIYLTKENLISLEKHLNYLNSKDV